MKNSIEQTENYHVLESYFRREFTEDGHFQSYNDILRATGLDIRATHSPRHYQVFAKVRDHLRVDDKPLMLEVIRGLGVQRMRIGSGAHAKADDAIAAIRRRSAKMIELANTGRIHAMDDEEAYKNQTMARVHNIILSRTTRDAKNEIYSSVSNGYHPKREFVGLRALLHTRVDAS